MIASLARRLPFYYGWVIVGVVFVTMGLGVNARTAFSLFLSPIIAEFGWQRATTAGAFSFGFLIAAFLSPTLGRVMDRYGPMVVMEFGVLIAGAGLLLAPLTTQFWHLYLTLGVLVGAGSICLGFTGQALFLPSWFVRHRGLAISLAFSGAGVGARVLLPWVQTLIEQDGWRHACTVLGVLVLAIGVPLNLLLRRQPSDLGLAPDGDGTIAAAAAKPQRRSNVVNPAWAATDWTLARAIRTARFWWICVGFFTALFAIYSAQVHQTSYLIEIGFSQGDAARALGNVGLLGIIGQIALGALSDRIGREPAWALSCLGFALTYGALIALHDNPSLPLMYAMVALQGLVGFGINSVFSTIPAEIFQGRHYGSVYGTIMISSIVGGAFGPWFTGFIHDRTGSYTPAFWVTIALLALSTFAIWRASPGKIRAVAGRMKPC